MTGISSPNTTPTITAQLNNIKLYDNDHNELNLSKEKYEQSLKDQLNQEVQTLVQTYLREKNLVLSRPTETLSLQISVTRTVIHVTKKADNSQKVAIEDQGLINTILNKANIVWQQFCEEQQKARNEYYDLPHSVIPSSDGSEAKGIASEHTAQNQVSFDGSNNTAGDISQLEEQLASLVDELEKSNAANGAISGQLELLQNEIDKLREDQEEKELSLSTEFKAKINEKNQKIKKLETDLKTAARKQRKLKLKQQDILRDLRAKYDAKFNKQEESAASQAQRVLDLENTISRLEKEKDSLVAGHQTRVKELQDQILKLDEESRKQNQDLKGNLESRAQELFQQKGKTKANQDKIDDVEGKLKKLKADLAQVTQNYEDEVSHKSKIIQKLNGKVEDLSNQNDQLTRQSLELGKENDALKAANHSLKTEIGQLNEKLKQRDIEIEQLREENTRLIDDIARNVETIQILSNDQAALKASYLSMSKQLERLIEENERQIEENERQILDNESLIVDREALQLMNQNRQAKIEALQAEIESLQAKMSENQAQQVVVTGDLATLQNNIEEKAQIIKDQQERIELLVRDSRVRSQKFRKQHAKLNKQLTRKQQEIQTLNLQKHNLTRELSTQNQNNKTLEDKLVNLQTELQTARENLDRNKKEITDKESQLERTNSQFIDLSEKLRSSQASLESKQIEIAKLKEEEQRLIDAHQKAFRTANDQINKLNAANLDQNAKIDGLNAQISDLGQTNKDLTDDHEKLLGQVADLVDSAEKLEKDLKATKDELSLKKEECARELETNKKIQAALEEKQRNLVKIQRELKTSEEQVEVQNNTILEKNRVLETLRTQIDRHEKHVAELEQNLLDVVDAKVAAEQNELIAKENARLAAQAGNLLLDQSETLKSVNENLNQRLHAIEEYTDLFYQNLSDQNLPEEVRNNFEAILSEIKNEVTGGEEEVSILDQLSDEDFRSIPEPPRELEEEERTPNLVNEPVTQADNNQRPGDELRKEFENILSTTPGDPDVREQEHPSDKDLDTNTTKRKDTPSVGRKKVITNTTKRKDTPSVGRKKVITNTPIKTTGTHTDSEDVHLQTKERAKIRAKKASEKALKETPAWVKEKRKPYPWEVPLISNDH